MYLKYPIFNYIYDYNKNFLKYLYKVHNNNILIFNYLYIKININIKYKSIITNNIILKELNNLTEKKNINIYKNKENLSFSNKKILKQKGTGKSRVRNKKNPIFKGGIKLFKNKKLRCFKINKKKWLKILNYILYVKKSFILILKCEIIKKNINNILYNNKNILLLSTLNKNYSRILNINRINFISILKYKYIFILI